MRHIDIVGLSLAELSLALIFVVLALMPPPSTSDPSSGVRSQLAVATTEIKNVSSQLAVATKRIDELTGTKKDLQNAASPSRPNLRSVALPSCAEINVRNDWLFTAVIRGEDLYDIDGVGPLSLQKILDQFQREVEEAKLAGCVQRIQVRVGNDISAKAYDLALRHLEQHFYPRKLGSEP